MSRHLSLALKGDGTVTAWGGNSWGQGDVPAGLTGVTAVAAGWNHSLALKTDGTVTAWGSNYYGQTDVPAGLTGVTAIAAGHEHSLALKRDGTVTAWGGSYGPVGPTTGVTAIAAGSVHSLALRSDGTVATWGGANSYGLDVVPTGLTGVTVIAAGAWHSLALNGDGTVTAWGDNRSGQTDVPAGLSGVTAIAGGGQHSLAINGDGTITAWGDNRSGQTDMPIGLTGVTAIAAGTDHTLALVRSSDITAPAVTITAPSEGASYTQHAPASAAFSCRDEDGGTGIATCTASVDGTPVTDGGTLPTGTVGNRTLIVVATDLAGNETTATRPYTVFAGFSGPIDPHALNVTKAGGSVPVGFSLPSDAGLDLFTAGSPSSRAVACDTLGGTPTDTLETTTTTNASGLQYDTTTDHYTYVWKTQKSWTGTCRQLVLTFGPNAGGYAESQITFDFRFR